MIDDIDPEVFLRIGEILCQNQQNDYFYIETNSKKKSLHEYKTEYLQKLNIQLKYLIDNHEKLIHEYNLGLEFNKSSINKITYLSNKLAKKNNYHHSNNTVNFLFIRMKSSKQILNETIENNIKNSQKLYELEKEINFIELCIKKTKGYIQLHS